MDIVSLSFWFSQNAVLSRENRRKAFLTNNVLGRLLLIGKSIDVSEVKLCSVVKASNRFVFLLRFNKWF